MGIIVEQQETGRVVVLEGTIDIASAAELKSALLDATADSQPWQVSLASATYLDITAMQLLWAAVRHGRAKGVEIAAAAGIPEAIANGLTDAGFEKFLLAEDVAQFDAHPAASMNS